MRELTRDQALQLFESGWWKGLEPRRVVEFQLFTSRLCMPFGDFHEAVEKALGRSVWTHEFAFSDALKKEFLGEREPPTLTEIMQLIPEDKRVLVVSP